MATLAPALVQLRNQINSAHPGRSKRADGWIGDSAHSARVSDHNPDSTGRVHAIDVTHDPSTFNAAKFVEALIAARDPRVKYIIHAGQIIAGNPGPSPWQRRRYTGSNPHTGHVHVSVRSGRYAGDTSHWTISLISTSIADVVTSQAILKALGHYQDAVDGIAGPNTVNAVKTFQTASSLDSDGILGPDTLAALHNADLKLTAVPFNYTDSIPTGTVLLPGQTVTSKDGKTILALQPDGNLVRYQSTLPTWQFGTRADRLALQPDGNLVAYLGSTVMWSTASNGKGTTHLAVQDDGNVVLYATSKPVWSLR